MADRGIIQNYHAYTNMKPNSFTYETENFTYIQIKMFYIFY